MCIFKNLPAEQCNYREWQLASGFSASNAFMRAIFPTFPHGGRCITEAQYNRSKILLKYYRYQSKWSGYPSKFSLKFEKSLIEIYKSDVMWKVLQFNDYSNLHNNCSYLTLFLRVHLIIKNIINYCRIFSVCRNLSIVIVIKKFFFSSRILKYIKIIKYDSKQTSAASKWVNRLYSVILEACKSSSDF